MRGWKGAAALTLVLMLSGCNLQQDIADQPTGINGEISPTPAPVVTGSGLNGEHLDISRWRGGPVVVDFWGSWCGPCRQEQPELTRLATIYAAKGVHFLGVDMRDNVASALAYDQDFKVTYPSVFDDSGSVAATFSVEAPPTIFVIDAHGQMRGRYLGTLTGLSNLLDKLLAERG